LRDKGSIINVDMRRLLWHKGTVFILASSSALQAIDIEANSRSWPILYHSCRLYCVFGDRTPKYL